MRQFTFTRRNKLYLCILIFSIFPIIWTIYFIKENYYRYLPRPIYELTDLVAPERNSNPSKFQALPIKISDERNLIRLVNDSILGPASRCTPYSLTLAENNYFSQFGQDKVIEELFGAMRQGFFVEAGGHDGEEYSNTLYFERNLEWSGLLVEPVKSSFNQILQRHRKCYKLHGCLSSDNKVQKITFHYGISKADASLYSLVKPGSDGSEVLEASTCYPLWAMLAALGNPVVDYFSLDIEGMEMKVLQSIPWDRVTFKVISVETNHLREGKATLRHFLREKGYVYYSRVQIDYIFYNEKYAHQLNL